MLRAIFSKDFFIPKRRSMKAKVTIQSKDFKASTLALIDSGATDSFLSPYITNRHNLPLFELPNARVIRNVDGTQNTIGKVTHVTILRLKYNEEDIDHRFYVIDLGTDNMIIGYPFLEAFNPIIDWAEGTFPGEILAFTEDAHLWTQEHQREYAQAMNTENFISSKEEGYGDHNDEYIPSNERGIIQNPNYYA